MEDGDLLPNVSDSRKWMKGLKPMQLRAGGKRLGEGTFYDPADTP